MHEVTEKLSTLGPEMVMLLGAVLCLLIGLSPKQAYRQLAGVIAAVTILISLYLAAVGSAGSDTWQLASFVKTAVAGVGFLLLMLAMSVPDRLESKHDAAHATAPWKSISPDQSQRGEFFAFFLLSLTGAMLCAGATDLVWLSLALELTSLPTYVLVATARNREDAQESGVKYFFLGAMAAAVFLYGFTMIYGATGSTRFVDIQQYVLNHDMSELMILGMVLSIIGVAFKIAAVPMHFYAADVYQGATLPVTAFLAFVPKTAGMVTIILLLGLVGWPLPIPIMWLIWIMAALTMTVGNVMGLLQTSVKRVLAYSSIAHSGYMLVGLIGNHGTNSQSSNWAIGSGASAVLFYLPAYGLATIGAFAVLGCLERRGEEADSFEDLAGLSKRSPGLAIILLISVLSLLGLPPLVGFVGKIYMFGSAIQHGFVWLVVIGVLNSAISAVYYLRIIGACYFREPDKDTYLVESPTRRSSATLAAIGSLVLGFGSGPMVTAARQAGEQDTSHLPSIVESNDPSSPTKAMSRKDH